MPEINDHPNGTLVEVPYQQKSVNLTCVSRAGKPAATITWYKNNEEVTDNQEVSLWLKLGLLLCVCVVLALH